MIEILLHFRLQPEDMNDKRKKISLHEKKRNKQTKRTRYPKWSGNVHSRLIFPFFLVPLNNRKHGQRTTTLFVKPLLRLHVFFPHSDFDTAARGPVTA